MKESLEYLRTKAHYAKKAWQTCQLDLAQAEVEVQPFVDYYNKRSKEIAKKYGKVVKPITASKFLHSAMYL